MKYQSVQPRMFDLTLEIGRRTWLGSIADIVWLVDWSAIAKRVRKLGPRMSCLRLACLGAMSTWLSRYLGNLGDLHGRRIECLMYRLSARLYMWKYKDGNRNGMMVDQLLLVLLEKKFPLIMPNHKFFSCLCFFMLTTVFALSLHLLLCSFTVSSSLSLLQTVSSRAIANKCLKWTCCYSESWRVWE